MCSSKQFWSEYTNKTFSPVLERILFEKNIGSGFVFFWRSRIRVPYPVCLRPDPTPARRSSNNHVMNLEIECKCSLFSCTRRPYDKSCWHKNVLREWFWHVNTCKLWHNYGFMWRKIISYRSKTSTNCPHEGKNLQKMNRQKWKKPMKSIKWKHVQKNLYVFCMQKIFAQLF